MNNGLQQMEANKSFSQDPISDYLYITKKLFSSWSSIPSTRRQGYLRNLRLILPFIPKEKAAYLSLGTAQVSSHVLSQDEAKDPSQTITSKRQGYTEQLLETLLALLIESFFVSYDEIISDNSLPSVPQPQLSNFESLFLSSNQTQSYLDNEYEPFRKTLLPANAVHPKQHLISEAYAQASPRPHHLIIAHLLHFLAKLAVNEQAPHLRRAALHALAAYIRCIQSSLLATFLPGLVSPLTRLLVSSRTLPATIVIATLDALLALVYTAFPTRTHEQFPYGVSSASSFKEALRNLENSSKTNTQVDSLEHDANIDSFQDATQNNKTQQDTRSTAFQIKRGSQWITKASAEFSLRLTLLFTSHDGLRSHNNIRVKSAMALFIGSLLANETMLSLADITASQMRMILVSLCGNDHPHVQNVAKQQLVALVRKDRIKLIDIERGLKALITYVDKGDHILKVKNVSANQKADKENTDLEENNTEKDAELNTIRKLTRTGDDDFWIKLGLGYLIVLKPTHDSFQSSEGEGERLLDNEKWIGISSRVGVNSIGRLILAIHDAIWCLSDDSEDAITSAMKNPVLDAAYQIGKAGLLTLLYSSLISKSLPPNNLERSEALAPFNKEEIGEHLHMFKERAHAIIILQEALRGAMSRDDVKSTEKEKVETFICQTVKELFMILSTFFLPKINTNYSPLLSSEDEVLISMKISLLYCVSRLLKEFSSYRKARELRPISGDIVLILLPSLLLDVSYSDDVVKQSAEKTLLTLANLTGCSSIRQLLGRHLNFTVSRIIRNLEQEWAGDVLRYIIGTNSDQTSQEATALLESTLANMCNNLAGCSDSDARKTLLSIRSVLSTAMVNEIDMSPEITTTSHPNSENENTKITEESKHRDYLYLKGQKSLTKMLLDYCTDDVPNYDELTRSPPRNRKIIDYWNEDDSICGNPFEQLALNILDGMRDLLIGRPWNVRSIALECATLAVKLLEGRYKVLLPHAANLLPLLPEQFSVLHEELNAGERLFKEFKRKKAQGKEDGEDLEDLVSFLNAKGSELPVVTNACLLISAFAEHAGSFIQDRFVQQIFPKLRPLLRLASKYPSLLVIRAIDGTGAILPTPSYGAMSASDACLEAIASISEFVPEVLSPHALTLINYLMVFIDPKRYGGTTGQRKIEHTNRTMVRHENDRMDKRVKLANCVVKNLKTVNPGDVLIGLLRHSNQKELIPSNKSFRTIRIHQ